MDLEALRAEIGYKPELSLRHRRDEIYRYLDDLDEGEVEMASSIAGDLLSNGRPLADTVVIIPVAAHQEAGCVQHALSQYANQEPIRPFTIVLGLNSPFTELGSSSIQDTVNEIKLAKSEHPGLDVRHTEVIYYEDPVIGDVRRDLWNGVAIAARMTGNFEKFKEVVGINHDIDLVRLSRRYISIIQQRYDLLDTRDILASTSPVFGTRAKHAFSIDHPNVSRAVLWSDFVYRQAEAAFEAGLVIPFSYYAKHGGFDREAHTHEVASLSSKSIIGPHILRGTNLETSIRRYVERMPIAGFAIWADPSSFSAFDKCREENRFEDITLRRAQAIVGEALDRHAGSIMQGTARRADRDFWDMDFQERKQGQKQERSLDEISQYIEGYLLKTGKLALFVLDRAMGSDDLNDRIRQLFKEERVKHFIGEFIEASYV